MTNQNPNHPSSWNQNLLTWYRANKRNFPWRIVNGREEGARSNVCSSAHERRATNCTAIYNTWVCEVMSQQTLMSVVLPKYNQFIETLPNVRALAECSESVLRYLWSGLGYYARARNLQKGAQYILNECGGVFPTSQKEWLKVPGCGPYTSAIIASICFYEPVAAVDGNLIRVGSRLLGLSENVWSKEVQESISRYLNTHVAVAQPGDFNQALMDLGALVCKKQNPTCGVCPLKESCTAFQKNITHLCPPPKPRPQKKDESIFAVVFRAQASAHVLLLERNTGFLLRTTGFPLFSQREGYSLSKITALLKTHGFTPQHSKAKFTHTITNHKITGHVVRVELSGEQVPLVAKIFSPEQKWSWCDAEQLEQSFSTSLDRKVYATVTLS